MPSDVSSVFAKKKGKKGKKKSTNLNFDHGIPKPEEKPKIAQLQEILGGADPSEDDGWADVVEKKSVVATGGKQVSDLIDMTTLMEEEESTASKLEKQDIKQAFHDARTLKEKKVDDTVNLSKEDEKSPDVMAKSKGLSGNIFGGGGAGRGGLGGGWQARMAERELKQREQDLSVDNAFAFPTLADAMSGPPKPKPAAVEGNPWAARRGGSSAAAAAIKAALGRGGDGESKTGMSAGVASGANTSAAPPAPKPKPAEPIWVAPRRGAETAGTEQETTRSVAESDGVCPARVESVMKAEEEAPAEPPASEPVIDTVKVTVAAGEEVKSKGVDETPENDGVEKAEAAVVSKPAPEATPKPSVRPTEAETALPSAVTDKEALVQQFGKKKKKKKKPVDGGDT